MKVAIVGLSESSRHLAPWAENGWELWGLAWDSQRYTFDRTFELHDWPDLERFYRDKLGPYLDKIQECQNLYMVGDYLRGCIPFPYDEVSKTVGDYWCSSIAYMLSLAIHEGAEEIGLYGIDMTDDYGYQKPNCEYLIGFARGRGIKVHIPEQSPLCKHVGPPDRDYDGRYGKTK